MPRKTKAATPDALLEAIGSPRGVEDRRNGTSGLPL